MTKRILFLIIALQLLISSTAVAIACNDGGIVDIPIDCDYDYPIKPGTPEWAELKNYSEMLEVCQVPEHILQCMSTEKLTKLCLEYPCLSDIFAFNHLITSEGWGGLDKLFVNFNGIRELAKRDGAANYLCNEYLLGFQRLEDIVLKYPKDLFDKFDNQPSSDYTDEEKLIARELGRSINKISLLESILGYSKFYNNIPKDDLKKVLKNLWFGYNKEIKYTAEYGFFRGNFHYNLFARANVIIKIDPTLSEIFEGDNKVVLLNGWATADLIDKMDSLTIELIK